MTLQICQSEIKFILKKIGAEFFRIKELDSWTLAESMV
jgi:hypothetical protein